MQNDPPSAGSHQAEQGKTMIDLLTMPETVGALAAAASAIAFIVVRHHWGRD
jgi:hypothetical protein